MNDSVVIHHSGDGHTRKQAEAITTGAAAHPGTRVQPITLDAEGNIGEANWTALAQADAIIFGSPTYRGGPSWPFKKFADASAKPWFGQAWKDKVAAGFTHSASINGDKLSTLHDPFTLAMQHGMARLGTGMLPANSKAAQRNDLNGMGAFAGAMAQSPSDASAEEGPLPGDLETAQQFGARIAATTARWKHGQVELAKAA
jgi:NAD(P)H dehydrogenase (quinone)